MGGRLIAADEAHDFVSADLPELRTQTAAHARGGSPQLGLAIVLDAGADGRDDDLAAFEAEGDLAARGDARRQADVFRDGDLSLFCDEHQSLAM